jgi:hypothetical protein
VVCIDKKECHPFCRVIASSTARLLTALGVQTRMARSSSYEVHALPVRPEPHCVGIFQVGEAKVRGICQKG